MTRATTNASMIVGERTRLFNGLAALPKLSCSDARAKARGFFFV